MEIKISNFRIRVDRNSRLQEQVMRKYPIDASEIAEFQILRQAIDARKKREVVYDYQFRLKLKKERPDLLQQAGISLYTPPQEMSYPTWSHPLPPVIVGFGPAGMFSALYLARCGAKPIVIERGSPIEVRKREVNAFFEKKELNPNSNVQFGEGGAGAFSDGKLATNLHHPWIRFILNEFYLHGATEDVTYSSTPHVGTDYLEKVVRNIREEIIRLGGTFHFNTIFSDFEQQEKGNNQVQEPHLAVYTKNVSDQTVCPPHGSTDKKETTSNCFSNNCLEISDTVKNQTFTTSHLLLCIGHSAHDSIRHLHAKGLQMEAKPFSIGVRIEHLQSYINEIQYGQFARFLPPASYKAAVHLKERSVYTFCMCPGGCVMASGSEPERIVTNGMSKKSRNMANANSALLVDIRPSDFYHTSPLDGLAFQEKYERLAFQVSGDYRAPANLVGAFLQGKVASKAASVRPSYPHGVIYCDFKRCLPPYVVDALRQAIPQINGHIQGFNHPDAVMTGIESRSSSSVRILRNDQRESNIKGIYPVGEGAGYAGGIVSAALDGLKTAATIAGGSFYH